MDRDESHITLRTGNLSIGYPGKGVDPTVVQENINLKVEKGSVVCLMGPNGAGKSTLLRTLAGIQPPLSGNIWVGKKSVQQLRQSEKAKYISLVLTDPVHAGNMTVAELVALGRYPHTSWSGRLGSDDVTQIELALEDLEIRELADRPLFELSDGQRQKALIARALAQDSPLMILDEPTSHLDLINRLNIMHLLKQMAVRRKKSILVATHELDLALQFADRLWLLQKEKGGLKDGSPEDLLLQGAIDQTFFRSGFHFDQWSGRFEQSVTSCISVQLLGDDLPFYWTQKALLRNGFKPVRDPADIRIEVKASISTLEWHISIKGNSKILSSINDLIRHLKSFNEDRI